MSEMVCPGGLSGVAFSVPEARRIITREKARLVLAWRERAITKPYSQRASLALDRALVRAEALGVRHDRS